MQRQRGKGAGVVRIRGDPHDRMQRRQRLLERQRRLAIRLRCDHHAQIGEAQVGRQVVNRQRGVERNRHGIRGEDAEEGRAPPAAVGHEHAHQRPAFDAAAGAQQRGHAVDALRVFAVGPLPARIAAPVAQGNLVGMRRGGRVKHVRDGVNVRRDQHQSLVAGALPSRRGSR